MGFMVGGLGFGAGYRCSHISLGASHCCTIFSAFYRRATSQAQLSKKLAKGALPSLSPQLSLQTLPTRMRNCRVQLDSQIKESQEEVHGSPLKKIAPMLPCSSKLLDKNFRIWALGDCVTLTCKVRQAWCMCARGGIEASSGASELQR